MAATAVGLRDEELPVEDVAVRIPRSPRSRTARRRRSTGCGCGEPRKSRASPGRSRCAARSCRRSRGAVPRLLRVRAPRTGDAARRALPRVVRAAGGPAGAGRAAGARVDAAVHGDGRCTGRWGPITCGTGAWRRRRWYCGGCCRSTTYSNARRPGWRPRPTRRRRRPRRPAAASCRNPRRAPPLPKPRRFTSIRSAGSGASPSGTDRHGRSRALHWPEWRWGRPATTGSHNRCG